MSYRISTQPTEVDSLSAAQVNLLVELLKQHRRLLESAHEDARRRARSGQRPAYLIDFDLLFSYMFEGEERPEVHQELDYLFTRTDTVFVIGPGTAAEIDRFLRAVGLAAGYDVASLGDLEALHLSARRELHAYGVAGDTIQHGIFRLFDLLQSLEIVKYDDLVNPVRVDEEAYEIRKAALDKRRPKVKPEVNQADALNWAGVYYLRRVAPQVGFEFHPYLLTATRPLLDEQNWDVKDSGPVSRSPRDAIYTEVLFEIFPDPTFALDHTIKVMFEAAVLQRDLQHSPAYAYPDAYAEEADWEEAVETKRVSEALRNQLEQLAEFVSDPVIYETQRIYENAQRAAESFVQQRGDVARSMEASPRKLFDLIIGIDRAIKGSGQGPAGLANLWSTVLTVRREFTAEGLAFRVCDSGSADGAPEYFSVILYRPHGGHPVGFLVLRWHHAEKPNVVIDGFCRVFAENGISIVDTYVGTTDGIRRFEADIPVSLDELLGAIRPTTTELVAELQEAVEDEYHGERRQSIAVEEEFPYLSETTSPPEIAWIRMDADPFDLYADLLQQASRDARIGVFTSDVDLEGFASLYRFTSARYLFPAWLTAALRSVVAEAKTVAEAKSATRTEG
jgi:hypothetical protein